MTAHIGAGPQHDANVFRIMPFFRNKAFNNLVRQLLTNFPSSRCGQRARVHTIKIATCGQQISPTARRRTARTGLNIFTIKATQHIFNFLCSKLQVGINLGAGIFAHLLQLLSQLLRRTSNPGQLFYLRPSAKLKILRSQ